jgi:hypothetical protein
MSNEMREFWIALIVILYYEMLQDQSWRYYEQCD